MTKKEYKYKISVIIPIYNVEQYLDETILSIINQSIGFNNIQLILVNDGSPDNCEEICLKYKNDYPDNIVYIKKKNGGVSSARNEGMKHVEGKYVHFLDSDDKMGKTCYQEAAKFLDEDDSVTASVFRFKNFEGKTTTHYLDWRFKGKKNRVVDLREEYNFPIFSVCSTLLRSKDLINKSFDTKLKIGEDYKFIAELIAQNPKIAAISSDYYYYRSRSNGTSAMQNVVHRKDNYVDIMNHCYDHMIVLKDKYKDASKWLQCALLTNLGFRIYNVKLECLDDKEKKEYTEHLRKLFAACDDDLIYYAYTMEPTSRYRAVEFKYKGPIYKNISIKDGYVYLNKKKVFSVDKFEAQIKVFEIKKDKLNITACFEMFLNNDYDMYIKADGKYHKFKKILKPETLNNIYSNDTEYYKTYFDIDFDLNGVKSFELYIKIKDEYYLLNLTYQFFSKMNELPHSYLKRNGFTITHKKNKFFVNAKTHFMFLKYLKDVLLIKKDILVFGMLLMHRLTYPFVRHNNWIVSDRFDVAGDNGEWMFKYIRKHSKKRNVYFGLSKKSRDNKMMSKIGKVIHFNTPNYYLKYMNSEVVLSSHIDDFIRRPFGKKQIYLAAFMPYRFVFLQHGVTKNDMSNWLFKGNKNIDTLVCSANMEYREFLNDRYIYNKDIVKLTGLPRYDNLYNTKSEEENMITFMPTWRSTLCGPIIPRSQSREYNPNFKDSEYYKFYNGIITDKRFTDCLKRNNIKVLFCLHPAFVKQLKDFKDTEYVTFKTEVYYPEVFKKAKLMLTDYSSVAFDFGFTKKPLIYAAFDKDHLYQIHTILTDDGEFDYEKDGFGPVTYDYESTIKELIRIIDGGFKNDKKYIDRVNKFFKYQDDHNCERVYNETLKMLERTK